MFYQVTIIWVSYSYIPKQGTLSWPANHHFRISIALKIFYGCIALQNVYRHVLFISKHYTEKHAEHFLPEMAYGITTE